jgi:hypothetical protein
MTVTLEAIEARQSELAAMIAKFKAPPVAAEPTTLTIDEVEIELQPGEHYAGLLLDEDGDPKHHLVLQPGDAEGLTWDAACKWAADQGGALPTRREQSLLFANAKQHFKGTWYWSSEPHAEEGSYAWSQYFDNGTQNDYRKSYEGRARAVRRLSA